jgi:hypothetical protein
MGDNKSLLCSGNKQQRRRFCMPVSSRDNEPDRPLASRFHHELVGIPGSGFPASETSIPAAKTSRRKKPVVLNNERSESSRSCVIIAIVTKFLYAGK